MKRLLISIAASLFIAGVSQAADVCIGLSNTGDGSGSNWNNQKALNSIAPNAFVRGNTYYLADSGSYGNLFISAISGTGVITFQKATVASHGPATGWVNALGDGTADFTFISVLCSYVTIDGAVGQWSSDWPGYVAYGIRVIANSTTANRPMVLVGDSINTGTIFTNVTLAHIEITQTNSITGGSGAWRVGQDGINTDYTNFLTIRSCWIHDIGRCAIFQAMARDLLVEYTVLEKNGWAAINGVAVAGEGEHSEMVANWGDSQATATTGGIGPNNVTYRYNVIRDQKSTGGIMIMGSRGQEMNIYGNIFTRSGTADAGAGDANGIINGLETPGRPYNATIKVYNNTFSGLRWGAKVMTETGSGTTADVSNNLFYDNRCMFGTTNLGVGGTTKLNNWYFGNNGAQSDQGGTQQVGTGNPFVNSAGKNFRLTGQTNAGVTFASPFNVDPDGVLRGSSGVWTRGAFQFGGGGGGDVTDPVISAISSGTPGQNTATITWTTDEAATSVVAYGTTTSYGSTQSNATLVTSHSIALSGLTPGTLYHYQITSVDASGNDAISADQTFTAASPADTTAPAVSLTAPSNGATVSDQVTVTATASDAVGVASVSFMADGIVFNIDTVAPYTTVWNSRSVSNGSRDLRARAADAAGNTADSNITVTVNNVADSGPVAWWNMDENTGTTATDHVSGNIATLVNGTTWAIGKFSSGLSFDGVNDRAQAPNSASLNIGGNAITVSAWVNLQSTGTFQQIVAKVKEEGAFTSPYYAWHLYAQHVDATHWTPLWQITNTADERTISPPIGNQIYGEWVHVVGVYDGTSATIYVNAVSGGSYPASGNIKQYTQPLYFGASGLPAEFMKGMLDHVKIWPYALTAQEVSAEYLGTSTLGRGPGIIMGTE